MMSCQRNIMKFEKMLEIISKKNLIVNIDTMKNIKELKLNLIREKSTQTSVIIKYQKKVPNVFLYQH